ncbi:hypothetical protein JW756_03440 [Candidatus Woesearchaeota archaeon]|nr:hypothetical protein [Candidatus Woesearchaeota archaeon]
MNKGLIGILCVMLAALIIVGCVPVARYYVCPDGKQVMKPEDCAPVQPEPEEKEVITEPVVEEEEPVAPVEPVEKEFTEATQNLFNKFDKVTSIKYSYVESPAILPENIYYTSKDLMKIVLKTKVKFSDKESYDTVYLDLIQKKGEAYCENRDRQTCPDRDKPYTIDYNKYFVETPFDWMSKLTWANLTGKSKTIESRNAIELSFEINGEAGTMFVDSYFSTPLYISFEGNTYEFRDISMNELQSTDLTHQFGQ